MADFLGLMKQAAALQAKMQEMQAELDQIEVEGTAGGGLVTVKLSAKGDMKGVSDRRLAAQAGREGDRRGPDGRGARRGATQGRGHHAGEDEGADRRPAAAARAEAVLIEMLPAPMREAEPFGEQGGSYRPPRTRDAAERRVLMGKNTHAHRRRRTRDRAPDPAARPPAGARAALGAARRAAPHQEARAADGAARRRAPDRDREDRGLPHLRQHRHAEPCTVCTDPRRDPSIIVVVADVADLWALERAHAINARYHVLGGTLSPLDGVGPQDLTIDALITRAHDAGGDRGDPRAQRHRRRPDHRPLHHRPAARRQREGDAARARRAGRRRARLSRRGHACRRRSGSARRSDLQARYVGAG